MGRPLPRPAFRRIVLALAITAGTLPLVDPAAACASNHGRPFLTAFAGGEDVGSRFYAVPENAGQATVAVGVSAGHCDSQPGTTADYATEDRTALAGEDYSVTGGTTARLCDDVDTPSYCGPGGENLTDTVAVPISNPGSGTDAAVESLVFRLTGADPFPPREPSSAPVHIVDDDGMPRASLEPALDGSAPVAYGRLEFGSVLIPVFRAGTGSSGTVAFSVEPDPSAPAQPGVDYQVVTQSPLPIGAGRVGFIRIDMVGDRIGEGDERVIVTLGSGGSLQVVPTMSSTTFTIVDNEESLVPESRFHHPRQGLRYKRDDFRIREIHIFATDEGGSGVVAAQLALRRNLKNGACVWLTKKGWQRDDCGDRRWLPTRYEKVAALFYYRMDPMKPSMGRGRIESYTAFSRAIDGAENVERDFDERRNANTFEIKRRKTRRD